MTDSGAGIADSRGHYRRQRSPPEAILGELAGATGFPVTIEQRFAWSELIELLGDTWSKTEVIGREE